MNKKRYWLRGLAAGLFTALLLFVGTFYVMTNREPYSEYTSIFSLIPHLVAEIFDGGMGEIFFVLLIIFLAVGGVLGACVGVVYSKIK